MFLYFTYTDEQSSAKINAKALFDHPSILQSHPCRHTGEKPFKCKTCVKAFNQLDNLQNKFIGQNKYLCYGMLCYEFLSRIASSVLKVNHCYQWNKWVNFKELTEILSY